MLVIMSLTAGLVLWIVLWSLGVKAIDGGLLLMILVLVAVGVRMVMNFLPGQRHR